MKFSLPICGAAALALTFSTLTMPTALADDPVTVPGPEGTWAATVKEVPLASAQDRPNGKDSTEDWIRASKALNAEKGIEHIHYFEAHSPSMGRNIPVAVITPDGTFDVSRPTIYLLNGAGGAEQGMDWITMTGPSEGDSSVVNFYAKKNVNIVIPQEGAFSYYTDWQKDPEVNKFYRGPQKWETFLVKELPGPLEEAINGNGKRAVAGMSMSATSSLLLAEHHPEFYDAVGSYSGCAATSTLIPRLWTKLTVDRGGGNPDDMWGPVFSDYARHNDALVNSNNLAGKEIYVSTNSGIAGETDSLSYLMDKYGGSSQANFFKALSGSSTLVVEGGAIEAAMNTCTRDLDAKMKSEGIDNATFNYRPTGTHSWPGWRKDIVESWPTYAKAFGQNEDPAFEDPARTTQ